MENTKTGMDLRTILNLTLRVFENRVKLDEALRQASRAQRWPIYYNSIDFYFYPKFDSGYDTYLDSELISMILREVAFVTFEEEKTGSKFCFRFQELVSKLNNIDKARMVKIMALSDIEKYLDMRSHPVEDDHGNPAPRELRLSNTPAQRQAAIRRANLRIGDPTSDRSALFDDEHLDERISRFQFEIAQLKEKIKALDPI